MPRDAPRPLRLLSLGKRKRSQRRTAANQLPDGGGVRGLCSLLYLDKIMEEVKVLESRRCVQSRYFPCDYFDLVGGTSTGG